MTGKGGNRLLESVPFLESAGASGMLDLFLYDSLNKLWNGLAISLTNIWKWDRMIR